MSGFNLALHLNPSEPGDWPPEAVTLLSNEWAKGTKPIDIVCMLAAIGVKKTKNSIAGKVHRLGLNTQYPRRNGRGRIVRASKPKSKAVRVRKPKVANEDRLVIKRPSEGHYTNDAKSRVTSQWVSSNKPGRVIDIVEHTARPSVLMCDALDTQCKWPASDDVRDMRVCGDRVTTGSYCDRHGQIAYRSNVPRGRQARFHRDQEF